MTRCLRTGAFFAAAMAFAASAIGAEEVELRGAWLWGRNCATRQQADSMLARADAMNLNALFVLIFYDGATAYYRSGLIETNPQVADGFDPLGHLVDEGAKRGIEIHAWFVNGPIRRLSKTHILKQHPDWQAVDLGGRKADWYDLCNPAVRKWQADLMVDVARRYRVRSVHFDYIRFNGPGLSATPAARREAAKDGLDLDAFRFAKLPAVGSFQGNPLAEPTTARTLAAFDDGVPAVCVNRVGKGEVLLLNWHAQMNPPQAINTALRAFLERAGAKPGGRVAVLDTDLTRGGRYNHARYSRAAEWVVAVGLRPRRVRDADLAKLPAGSTIVLPQHYCMTDEQAGLLLRHVEAGGRAVFIDGPVFALRESKAARQLLGFKKMGRYFVGTRTLRAAKADTDDELSRLVPAGGKPVSADLARRRIEHWNRWRKDQITKLVAEVYRRVKKAREGCLVTAAVFRTKDAADRVVQDWPRWLREGILDYAVPMSYVKTAAELKAHFAWWKTFDPKLARTIPAVGMFRIGTGKPPAERASLIAEQIDCCRKQNARGVVLFNLRSIDDETAALLGRTVFKGQARPYAPGGRSE